MENTELLDAFRQLRSQWGIWGSTAIVAASVVLVYVFFYMLFRLLRAWILRENKALYPLLIKYAYRPSRSVAVVIGIMTALPLLELPPRFEKIINHGIELILITVIAHWLIRLITGTKFVMLMRYDNDLTDNLKARKVYTQFRIIERILIIAIIILAVGVGLMTFEKIRQVGVSLLASAGVIGVIMGLAAQRSIGMMFAGIQIAIAQPIRIEDVVVVEGEWGNVEEITLTYVSIRLWDERRLIVPINYFIEKPFQNWTRSSTNIMGTVMIYADYTIPISDLREAFTRFLRESSLWDGRVGTLVVTDATSETIQIRALMSSSNADYLFELRTFIREKLITYIRENYPNALPRRRVESFVQQVKTADEQPEEDPQNNSHEDNPMNLH
ncbi:Small-conductance mechanosensitive channel [Flexibacter flexilis DSM 6793]|uniref:Small-conductance mechanosensitive channel n=1 Tax=Flexibacter flexilis DSM 6793 TaxID=927664 RepID=A0A1I1DX17_9BACT|nr:mechanosensitive ion channel domain-containing protein [Flexibacter flexilis]SFB77103.1 Small-conductance mechanosensitive channel [Flexibacter flexilis DSM 6793]